MTSWCSASVNAFHVGMNTSVARSSDFPEDGRNPNLNVRLLSV